jgi:hypothetical protein
VVAASDIQILQPKDDVVPQSGQKTLTVTMSNLYSAAKARFDAYLKGRITVIFFEKCKNIDRVIPSGRDIVMLVVGC